MTRYRLSPAAERDLEEILDYTVQQWGLGQALRYGEKLESAFEVLAASPDAGLDSGEVRAGYRRLSVGRHVIYFRRTDYGAAVIRSAAVRIWAGSQRVPESRGGLRARALRCASGLQTAGW